MEKTKLFPLVVSPEERIRFKLNDTTTVSFCQAPSYGKGIVGRRRHVGRALYIFIYPCIYPAESHAKSQS
jgi:hypothetical protein